MIRELIIKKIFKKFKVFKVIRKVYALYSCTKCHIGVVFVDFQASKIHLARNFLEKKLSGHFFNKYWVIRTFYLHFEKKLNRNSTTSVKIVDFIG